MLKLENSNLSKDGVGILTHMPQNISLINDPLSNGAFLNFDAQEKLSRHKFTIGKIKDVKKFVCNHRKEPFFADDLSGCDLKSLPIETQWLLISHTNGSYTVILPILNNKFRCSLAGSNEGNLVLIAESGDTQTINYNVIGLFLINDNDPYAMMKKAAESVTHFMKSGKLRKDKKTPRFVDYFGWCTWNSFGPLVTKDKIKLGLESFKEGGLIPKFLLLDDGWQTINMIDDNRGAAKISDFVANENFNYGLSETVKMAKNEFGVSEFFVWHAIIGYWGGSDKTAPAMAKYNIQTTVQKYSECINEVCPKRCEVLDFPFGFIPPDKIYDFYNDYHTYLKNEGVDGIKVDVQSTLESLGEGLGGRVAMANQYHNALEKSVRKNFNGGLINCMSTSNDIVYSTLDSTVLRSSADFAPSKMETHSLHIYTNAISSMWMGNFVMPDWDMFQSGHSMGWLHGAARAISGGPIYVSDEPDSHDFDILNKLVLSDGKILRAKQIGLPTRDSLFIDPFNEPVLFKIFNKNACTGIVGAFNFNYVENDKTKIEGYLSPFDIEGIQGDNFAVYSHNSKALYKLDKNEKLPISIEQLACDLFTITEIKDGFAPIGLANKFNSGGAIIERTTNSVIIADGGEFVAYCENAPKKITVDNEIADFTYNNTMKKLTVLINTNQQHLIEIEN